MESARGDEKKTAEVKKKIQINRMKSALAAAIAEPDRLIAHSISLSTNLTRLLSVELRELEGVDACPVLPSEFSPLEIDRPATRQDVVTITLTSLPVPDEQTPWEQIIDYRNDPDSKEKFLDLRHWMSDVARSSLTPLEVEEKLEYLLSRYRRRMELHNIKINTTLFESVVVTSADVLGNLASFQWGKASQVLFSLKRRKLDLLEGELTAEGSEVAYIIKARNAFHEKESVRKC